ncbi:MAG: GNAT family N-acetyltransferase [Alphaproteobacteria bacterium]|nr:GNAT family N-acetyltransferase [Alphaproteobacteria bacterium]
MSSFAPFTPDLFAAHEDAFLAIAADQPHEYWRAEHFLAERPGKWRLSFAAMAQPEAVPIGYAILSQPEPARVHLHHFMLRADRRGHGLGTRMLDECVRRARAAGASDLTLKIDRAAPRARAFYARAGFVEADDGAPYLGARLSLDAR